MVTVFSGYSTLLQLRRQKNLKFPLLLIDFKVIAKRTGFRRNKKKKRITFNSSFQFNLSIFLDAYMKLQIDCHKKVGKFNLQCEKSPLCLKQTEAFSFKPPEYKLLTVVGVNCFALNEPSRAA